MEQEGEHHGNEPEQGRKLSACATANLSAKKHGKCIISVHRVVIPKSQELEEGALNARKK